MAWPYDPSVPDEPLSCCNPEDAQAWLEKYTVGALEGDRVSIRLLPEAVYHWLRVTLQAQEKGTIDA